MRVREKIAVLSALCLWLLSAVKINHAAAVEQSPMLCTCTCQPLDAAEPIIETPIIIDSENESSSDDLSIDNTAAADSPTAEPEDSPPAGEPSAEPVINYAPGAVLISEFVADPITGEKEWIEIYNASTSAIDLTGWTLAEGAGQKTALSGAISAGQYLVFDKANLNNSGDIIILFDPTQKIIDQVVYGNWDDGDAGDNAPAAADPYSIIRRDVFHDSNVDAQDFVLTTVVTKGAGNVYLPLVIENSSSDDAGAPADSTIVIDSPTAEPEDSPPAGEPSAEPVINYAPGAVLISEFVADPITGEKEWIEIYNASTSAIDLTGWTLAEGAGQKTALSGAISAGQYLVFDKANLNNSGDIIILFDPTQKIIDQVVYGNWDDGDAGDNAPAAADPYSIIRRDVFHDSNVDAQDFVLTTVATKGAGNVYLPLVIENSSSDDAGAPADSPTAEPENSPPTGGQAAAENDSAEILMPGYEYSTQIRINEFLPNPAGNDSGQEWIELFNFGAQDLNLKGWTIDDEDSGGSTPYVISQDLMIAGQGYLILTNDQTKIILNNTTDAVRLIDPNQQVISQVSYAGGQEGWSYALINDDWQWTDRLTPLAANLSAGDQADDSAGQVQIAGVKTAADQAAKLAAVDLAMIAQLELGAAVQVQGVVAAEPGVFGARIMYLDGLQVYNSKENWPELAAGDLVQVSGKISEASGQRRVLVAQAEDIKIISQNSAGLQPLPINSEHIGEELESRFVEIKADFSQKNGVKMIMVDERGEFIAYLNKNTGLTGQLFAAGKSYLIRGIITQYKDEYRIMPRGAEDIEEIQIPVELPAAVASAVDSETVPSNQQPQKVLLGLLISLSAIIIAAGAAAWYYREKIACWFTKIKLTRKAGN